MAIRNENDEVAKGVQMGKHPYLWRENNPVHPYMDTPCENFAPTPSMHTGEDSKGKRIIKYVALGVFVAFMLYAFIAICVENPQLFELGKTGQGHFFK